MLNVRNYQPDDYETIKSLYQHGDLYGGQFDDARDSAEKLAAITTADPQSILVCEKDNRILGTISLIENERVAWLYRFAVSKGDDEKSVTAALHQAACNILISRGHQQVLIYSPQGQTKFDERYMDLGMNKGNAYTCFWQALAP